MKTRSQTEINHAIDHFFDKVWYVRHLDLMERVESGETKIDQKIWKEAQHAAAKIEKRFDEIAKRDRERFPISKTAWEKSPPDVRKFIEEHSVESLYPRNDYEWGMMNGKLSALRWVLGDDWDCLDT